MGARAATIDLTDREKEILIASRELGKAKDVARAIGVSKRTVDFHLSNIYAKLNLGVLRLAIYKAEDTGLIPPRARRTW